MDSPFLIGSIDTPLHQPEEEQQILASIPTAVGSNASHAPTTPRPAHTYAPVYSTPHSLIQPQTPVIFIRLLPF